MIKEFSFPKFDEQDLAKEAKNIAFKELDVAKPDLKKLDKELSLINDNSFEVAQEVKDLRGYAQLEKEKFEKRVISEVDIRLNEAAEEMKERGYQEGLEQGKREGMAKAESLYLEKLNKLEETIAQIEQGTQSYIEKNIKNFHRLIKNSVKWILLRELQDEKYVENLLHKLVYELNEKDSLLIKVDEETKNHIELAISKVESEFGKLANCRVEVDAELSYPSIILEGNKGIIDGSLHAQFRSLDNLFASVASEEIDDQEKDSHEPSE